MGVIGAPPNNAYAQLSDLLTTVADPKAASERVQKLQQAEAAAEKAKAEAAEERAALKAERKVMNTLRERSEADATHATRMLQDAEKMKAEAQDMLDEAAATKARAVEEAAQIIAEAKRDVRARVEQQVRAAMANAFEG